MTRDVESDLWHLESALADLMASVNATYPAGHPVRVAVQLIAKAVVIFNHVLNLEARQ